MNKCPETWTQIHYIQQLYQQTAKWAYYNMIQRESQITVNFTRLILFVEILKRS